VTIIIGLATDDGVWMGADGVGQLGDNLCVHFKSEKVHEFQVERTEITGRTTSTETLLIGSGGAYLVGQLIHHELQPRPWSRGMPAEVYVRSLVTDLFAIFQRDEYTWGRIHDNQPPELLSRELLDATLLIGFAGRLWTVLPDSSLSEMREDYAALGCALETALGAMHVTAGVDPRTRITDALEACNYHHADIGPPFVLKFAPYRKEK